MIKIHELLILVTEHGRLHIKQKQVLCVESDVDVLEISQRANQQACTNQKQHRDRHLDHDESPAQPRASDRTRAPACVFKRRSQIEISRAQRRQESKDQSGEERKTERKTKHAQVEFWIESTHLSPSPFRHQQETVLNPEREENAECAPDRRQ